jgi:maltooligosyltrehalose trehalohydrolase
MLASFEDLKLAAAATILSPYVPMLFMGEEYGETAPFCYFISHLDAGLVAAVREGRRRDFASFAWQGEPPDPQAVATFERCKLDHTARQTGRPAILWHCYQELLRLRKTLPALTQASRQQSETQTLANGRLLLNRRWRDTEEICLLLSFADAPVTIRPDLPAGDWLRMFDSSETHWEGPGSLTHETYHAGAELTLNPRSAVLLGKEA